MTQKRKVLLCGTHPQQFNGYSKVVFELSRELCKFEDIQLYVYGFQNFYEDADHMKERQLPESVEIYDPYKNEDPKNKGFGEKLINDYIMKTSPDIVIVYNDLIVISSLMKNMLLIPDRKFKIVPYIDIVYKNETQHLINYIHENCDGGIAFTEYWKKCLLDQCFTKKLWTLEHAFNRNQYYPIPKHVARKYFELGQDDFIIMNLNRNQPRKRWDTCIKAYVKFVSRHRADNIKLLVMTSVKGSWDLIELMKFESKKYGMSVLDLKSKLTFIQNPQKMSDQEINIMYNAADIGWNTCDGEGFGLCNFEQAGVGVPQVVPNIGGFKDFFNSENSILVDPVIEIHGDTTKDACGGDQELCLVDDFVRGLEAYYTDVELRKRHGVQCRKDILKYTWKEKAAKLRNTILESTEDLFSTDTSQDLMQSINQMMITEESSDNSTEEEDIDIDKLINDKLIKEGKLKVAKPEVKENPPKPINKTTEPEDNKDDDLYKMSPKQLLELQKKIDKVLNSPIK